MFFMCLLLLLVLGVVVYNICGDVHSWSDHYGWGKNSTPDKEAKIQNITSERVQFARNEAKFKTTVTFSDGFYFITYKTNRDNSVLTYKIYISDELKNEIINSAIKQHISAVDRFID